VRIGFVILLAIVLGLTVALASSIAEFGHTDVRATLSVSALPLPAHTGPASKLVVDNVLHEFGEMFHTDVGRHTFVLHNSGKAMLVLGKSQQSCQCTVANISRKEIPPGETAEVAVEWKPVNMFGEITKLVTLPTNDPDMQSLVLTIKGTVLKNWRFDVPTVDYQEMGLRETKEKVAHLLLYQPEPGEITGFQWENESAADYLDFNFEPLTPAELAAMKPVPKSGWRLTCTARPGLPLGNWHHRLLLKTTLQSDPMTLDLVGQVSDDITIFSLGGGYDPHRRILDLRAIPAGTVRSHELRLKVIGPDRDSILFNVTQVRPEGLQVTIGKPQASSDSVVLVPVTFIVPPTLPPVKLVGDDPAQLGRVVIQTTHPEQKELEILVRMTVEEPGKKPK